MIRIEEIEGFELSDVDRGCLARLNAMKPDDIDLSDIPEITDWTDWVRHRDGKPVVYKECVV